MVGNAKVHNAALEIQNVRLHDVDGGATLHVTPTELLLTAMTGYLPGGGSATGESAHCELAGRGAAADVAASSPTTKAAVTTTNKTAKAIGAKAPVEGE